MRREKHQSVDEIARLTRDSKRCFRKTIRAAFGDEDRTTQRPFSIWLLEHVFSASGKRTAKSDCCDACVRAKGGTEAWVLGLMQRLQENLGALVRLSSPAGLTERGAGCVMPY